MIEAEIFKQPDGKIFGFAVEGHANTAPYGQDIYCAGVSTITQSAFLCLRDYLKRDFDADFDHGKLVVILKTPADELTEAVFQTVLIGLQEIEKIGPQILKLSFIEVKE